MNVIIRAVLRSSSTGLGLTTLTYSSPGLIVSTINDVEATATAYSATNIVAVTTLGTYAAPAAGKCSFSPVDITNHPGLYEIQIANARLAVTNAKYLIVTVSGVSGLADTHFCIPLRSVNPYDGVHFGLTALPNTPCTTNASLLTSGTGTDQLKVSTGAVALDLTQAFPTSNTAQTVGDALNAARAQGFGKWALNTVTNVLSLYAADGATVVRSFTLDSSTAPTTRT